MTMTLETANTGAVQPRPYQEEAIAAVLACAAEGRRRVLLTMATGTGKSSVLTWIIQRWPAAGTAVVLAHREELIQQLVERVCELIPRAAVSIEKAEMRAFWGSDVVVASLPTLAQGGARRAKRLKEQLDVSLVIYDEAHHAFAPGNRSVLQALGCFEAGGPFLLGCTATPNRADRKSLGHIFECEAYNYGLRPAIAEGWLCPIVGYRVQTETDLSGVKSQAGDFMAAQLSAAVNCRERSLIGINYWKQVAGSRQTIAFCVDVAHAEDTATLFGEHGVRAAAISGRTPPGEREDLMRRFRGGEIQVLANCAVLTEGVDVPAVSCILMLRPTKSESLYAQMAGRGLRPHDDNPECVLIDLVDNCARNRLVTAPVLFGLPETLDTGGKRIDRVREQVEASGVPVNRLEGLRGLDELRHRMEEWDLFAAVELPAAVERLTERLWTPWGEGYHLSLRDGREARIEQDAAGHYTGSLWERGKRIGVRQAETMEEAFQITDRAIERLCGAGADWTKRKATWIKEPCSARQRAFLKRHGVPDDLLVGLTKGKAGQMITRVIQKEAGDSALPAARAPSDAA